MRNIICFHNPQEENGYLSNWFESSFKIDNIEFVSMEQYMMYEKAVLFNDMEIAAQILKLSDAATVKSLGRAVRNYNDVLWNGVRQIVIYKGLIQKFSQNESLKKQLLETSPHILAECAVNDKIWGIGLSMKDENRFNMKKWSGQNLLGFTLMQVRNDLERKCL
ncbi:MAG TPA: DUF1768 domain-containing protein [Ruminococcus sp.]|nr:DUF1768 domain-containing protein [Ruminococcus sp.]HCR74370.1 DUF1768 domain-containing protein [Ruminococcus sp.]